VREAVRTARFDASDVDRAVEEIRSTMASATGLFARHIRRYRRRGLVSDAYPLSGEDPSEIAVLQRAAERLQAVRQSDGARLEESTIESVRREVPGLLPPEAFQP
jgi:hypothetical protein